MQNTKVTGYAAGLSYALIWSSWLVMTRLGVTTTLTAGDVAVLRFAVPAILLSPLLLNGRTRRAIGAAGWKPLLFMAVGAGAPMFLLAAYGMRYAPAAHAGALLPGSMPLFVAVLSFIVLGERMGGLRSLGFGLIFLGDLFIGGYNAFVSTDGAWRGHLMFLSGAFLWGTYTLGFRRSGLTPWQGALWANGASFLTFVPLHLLFGDSKLAEAPVRDLVLQTIFQGGASGLAGMALYGLAVSKLGASRGAAFTSLTPVGATLLAIPILGEIPDLVSVTGIFCVALGVAMASGTFERSR